MWARTYWATGGDFVCEIGDVQMVVDHLAISCLPLAMHGLLTRFLGRT
jgi:hypothetical protein